MEQGRRYEKDQHFSEDTLEGSEGCYWPQASKETRNCQYVCSWSRCGRNFGTDAVSISALYHTYQSQGKLKRNRVLE